MDLVTKKYPQNLRLDTDSGNIHIYGNMLAQRLTREQEEPRRLKITLSNFRYVNPQIDPTILKKINSQVFVYKVSFEVRSVDFGDSYQLSNGSDFVRHIEDEFDKVSQLAIRLGENPQLGIQDIVGKRVLREIERAPAIRDDYLQDRYQRAMDETRGVDRMYPGLTRDIVGVPKSLQNEFIIQTLKSFISSDAKSSQKVVGYCVARALQLLDANTLSLPKPKMGVSSVCLGRFADMPSAVPVSGQSLDKVTGLKALEQLYSTKPSLSQKEEVIVQKDDPAEYAKFLQDISTIFGGPAASSQLTSLDKIIVKDPACPVAAVKHYLQIVDERSVQTVLGFVNQLFARQINHTQKVLKFFREKLFRIIKGPGGQPQIELHPFILKGGIDILTLLSKDARNLLLEYYKGCEETYQKGVQAILAARTIPMANPV
jgi:hypothetical protein